MPTPKIANKHETAIHFSSVCIVPDVASLQNTRHYLNPLLPPGLVPALGGRSIPDQMLLRFVGVKRPIAREKRAEIIHR